MLVVSPEDSMVVASLAASAAVDFMAAASGVD
jgi:hypothetical protein